MTWWVLTGLQATPAPTSAVVLASTNNADFLYMAWAYHKPSWEARYKTVRGRRLLCGHYWKWDTPTITPQTEPGDTLTHTFSLSNLTPLSTIWYYLFALEGPYDREIQGPLCWFTLPFMPPGPIPTDEPIYWAIPGRILRCGNRYTFWANNTWYAFIPTSTSLTVWKLIDSVFNRLDQANEPTPAIGAFWDADARLDSLSAYIHIAFYQRSTSPNDHLCRYVKFALATDTWGSPETAHAEPYHGWPAYHVSLALDSNDKPHVVFPRIDLGFPIVFYRNKVAASWSAPEMAIWSHYRVITCDTCWIDPTNDAFHVCAVTNMYLHWYNKRPAGGSFQATLNSLLSGTNLPQHSLAAGVTIPHIAQISQTWRVNHWEGIPPSTHQDDLTLADSHFANMISSPAPPGEICIVYADLNNKLATIHRPPGGDWGAEQPTEYDVVSPLTAHYAHPDVIAALWECGGSQDTAFHAFYAPWH